MLNFLLYGCNMMTFAAVCAGLGALFAYLISLIFGLDIRQNILLGAVFGMASGPMLFILSGGEFETGPLFRTQRPDPSKSTTDRS